MMQRQKPVYQNGNWTFTRPTEWADERKWRAMRPPELLWEVSNELMQVGEFDLSVGLRDIAAAWDEDWAREQAQVWAERLGSAMEAGLSELSRTRLKMVQGKVEAYLGDGEPFAEGDPYLMYAEGTILWAELKARVGRVDLARVRAANGLLRQQDAADDDYLRSKSMNFRP